MGLVEAAFVVSETGGVHSLVSPIVSAIFSQPLAPIPARGVGSGVFANKAPVTLHMWQRWCARPSSPQLFASTVGHSYGQYGCPPVFLKESEVDNMNIRNGDTRVAPPILTTCMCTKRRKGKCTRARGMLAFQRRRQTNTNVKRLAPRKVSRHQWN